MEIPYHKYIWRSFLYECRLTAVRINNKSEALEYMSRMTPQLLNIYNDHIMQEVLEDYNYGTELYHLVKEESLIRDM